MMGRTEQEDNFSNNVIWYNFILCVLVILIHARNDSIFTLPVQISGFPVFNELEAFLASDVAGAAVGVQGSSHSDHMEVHGGCGAPLPLLRLSLVFAVSDPVRGVFTGDLSSDPQPVFWRGSDSGGIFYSLYEYNKK